MTQLSILSFSPPSSGNTSFIFRSNSTVLSLVSRGGSLEPNSGSIRLSDRSSNIDFPRARPCGLSTSVMSNIDPFLSPFCRNDDRPYIVLLPDGESL